MDLLMKLEGGYADLAGDPGGATKCGITDLMWQSWRTSYGLSPKPLQAATEDDVWAFYWDMYWCPFHCQGVPWPLSAVYLQCAVNLDPGSAIKCLQIGVMARPVDGIFGPETQHRASVMPLNHAILQLLAAQSAFYAFHPERYESGLQDRVTAVYKWWRVLPRPPV
jgi:lysozyme family protein